MAFSETSTPPALVAGKRQRANLPQIGVRRSAFSAFLHNLPAVIGAGVIIGLTILSLGASVLYPGDPLASVAAPLLPVGANGAYPLGTDSLGRDLAALVVHGARTSLFVGVAAAAIATLIGAAIGGLGGYFGGRTDAFLVGLTELFQTIPTFLLAIIIVAIERPSAVMIALAIGFSSWPVIARLVRAEFRQLLQSDFILAARSLGFRHARIILTQLMPNALPSVIVAISAKIASAILMESGLSFLGLGDPSQASWGGMINEGRDLLRTAWHLSALPGVALAVTVLSFNLIGDGLNDALNPRLRDRSA